jgi:NADPH-dependent F420 reductase
MKIAVIGNGNIGSRLAKIWAQHEHDVTIGVRSEAKIAEAEKGYEGAQAALVKDAVAVAEVVLLAVPWPAVADVLKETGSAEGRLDGKIVIDAINPVKLDLSGLESVEGGSVAVFVQKQAPIARVVKAFNTLGAMYLGNGSVKGITADGLLCGDDQAAIDAVSTLVEQAGLNPVDVGPLHNAYSLEALALLWIDLAVIQKRSGRFAFQLLTDADPAAEKYSRRGKDGDQGPGAGYGTAG